MRYTEDLEAGTLRPELLQCSWEAPHASATHARSTKPGKTEPITKAFVGIRVQSFPETKPQHIGCSFQPLI